MLNQFFENPIKQRQFAIIINIEVSTNEKSNRLLNIQNSIENFRVPGRPAKNTHIKKIAMERLGRILDTPFI